MWGIIAIGGVILWYSVPRGRLFYSGMFGIALLVLGAVNWIYILVKSFSVHAKVGASVNRIDRLITEGTYAVVRHPIYAADIVFVWCIFLYYPAFVMLFIAVWATIVFVFWSALEERMLEEKFLDDYRAYKQQVPRFIPRFNARRPV